MTLYNFRYFSNEEIIERRPQYFNFLWSESPIIYVHECVFSVEAFRGTLQDFILHMGNDRQFYIHYVYFEGLWYDRTTFEGHQDTFAFNFYTAILVILYIPFI